MRSCTRVPRFLSAALLGFFAATATPAAAADLNLAWNDNTADEDGFEIERQKAGQDTESDSYTRIASLASNTTTFTDAGLPPETTYCYRIRAFNAAGESLYSQSACAKTATAVADSDADGLIDSDEIHTYGTNPDSPDTDGDGLVDSHEVNHGTDPLIANTAPQLEVGEVAVNHRWTRVTFTESFTDPIVVATGLSSNDAQPAVVRIQHVDAAGFDVRVQEWDYLDGWHPYESVSYIVIERGNYTLANGTRIEAERMTTHQATHATLRR